MKSDWGLWNPFTHKMTKFNMKQILSTCLIQQKKPLYTSDGHPIDVWDLSAPPTTALTSDWAKKFRQHYCADADIDDLCSGPGLCRSEYLTQLVFPNKAIAPGPAIRSGDFAELLISDYIEYLLGYWVPRAKYAGKSSPDESVKGVDILGFRQFSAPAVSPKDTLLAFEVKAQLSDGKYTDRLQTAINDSSKDHLRRAISLNATKQRLKNLGQIDRAILVERFQNIADRPYIYLSGAAAVLSDTAYDVPAIQSKTSVVNHQNTPNIKLVVIRGNELMKLVHALYERAANEA